MTNIDVHTGARPVGSGLPRTGQPRRAAGKRAMPRSLIVDFMVAADALIIVFTALATKLAYLDLYLEGSKGLMPYAGLGVVLAAISAIAFRQFGLQQQDNFLQPSIRIGRIFGALGTSFLMLLAILYLLKTAEAYSRGWMLLWFVSSFLLIVAMRSMVKLYVRGLVARGRLSQRVAVYGAGPLGWKIRNHLRENADAYQVIGIFDAELYNASADALPIDGSLDDLVEAAKENGIDQVILALPMAAHERIRSTVARLSSLPIEVQLCSEEQRLPCKVYGSSRLGPLQLLQVQRRPLTERGLRIKAAFDIVLAGAALVILSPLFPLIAAAIKLDSAGPVFFRQRRHGFNHRVIQVLKFRTMSVLEDGPLVKQAVEAGDARVTRVGRILRRTCLDEIPQLVNVLKGEMSFVGPRPHALAHNEYYGRLVESYANRHRVKPGITGWAQVNGFRGETADCNLMRKRVEFDLYYIDHWSVWLDIEVLVRTVLMVLSGQILTPAGNRKTSVDPEPTGLRRGLR